ncbi:MAG: penicillin-binding protein 2 [Pseudomonadota bacterium]
MRFGRSKRARSPAVEARAPNPVRRGLVLMGLQAAVITGLGLRLRHLQVDEAETFRLLAEENRINIRLIPPARGLIFDRNGQVLAENRQNYRVTLVREQAGDVDEVLAKLATLIDLPQSAQDAVKRDIAKRSAFVPVTVAEHLSWDALARVAANAPALPGVTPEVGLTRHYPQAVSMAHVVGYVGPVSERDLNRVEDPDPLLQIPDFQIGKTGVEQRQEAALRGAAGASRIEVNAVGRVMRELSRQPGQAGTDLQLTVDKSLQDYALARMTGQSAAAVVLEIESGDILASASAPSFDPNDFVFGISQKNWDSLLNNTYRPLSNKPVSGAYPPGSTYKMLVALAALAEGVVSPGETVWCPGHYDLGRRRFHCWRRGGHGHVDLEKSLQQSCDVYYYEIAKRVGIEKISAMARTLGLGQRYNLPIPAISEGLTPTKAWKQRVHDEAWLVGDTLNSGIGQGFTLSTPLQLAVMTARLASGKAVEPRIIRATGAGELPRAEAPPLDLPAWGLRAIRQGMDAVVNSRRGTAYRSRIIDPEHRMAGKTGTSQVRIITAEERAQGVFKNEDLPWNRRDHALFIGYAPFENPRHAVAVVVEHGGGGSKAAAPIARDVLMYAAYGGLPPLTAYPETIREEIEIQRALPQSATDAGEERDRV